MKIMKRLPVMSSSDSAEEEEEFPGVQNLGIRGRGVRTYSKSEVEKPLKKASRVEVNFKEDNLWDNIVDSNKSRRGNIKETKEKADEDFFLFQLSSRGVVGNLGSEEKTSSRRGKQSKTLKKLKNLPLSKSPTEEDCSYGWQHSCWHCSRKSTQLRHCSACQVAAYCSPLCQKEGWLNHKERCERECTGTQASASTLIKEESKTQVKKVGSGRSKMTADSPKIQANVEQAGAHGDEVEHGKEGAKTVCFNSQPQFAPSQEATYCDGDEKAKADRNTEVGTSLVQPKSILKIPKESVDITPKSAHQCPVKSPPIDLTSSPSQPIPTPPTFEKQASPKARLPTPPTSPSAQSALEQVGATPLNSPQVDVTPPNSPTVLASVRKGSQAKPRSERRRSTPYPIGAQSRTQVKLMEEVDDEKKSEVDEQGEGAEDEGAIDDEEVDVEDRGLWLKPQRLDFADISELEFVDFDSNFTDEEGSSCDVLNTVREIVFPSQSQSTDETDMKRSPDIFSSQDGLADMFSSDGQ